jgi:hypothetical protein
MLLDRRTVSRKTQNDGRLEIGESAHAALLARAGSPDAELPLTVRGEQTHARLADLRCDCAKAQTTGEHRHFFLESDRFRALEPYREVTIDLDEGSGAVAVEVV